MMARAMDWVGCMADAFINRMDQATPLRQNVIRAAAVTIIVFVMAAVAFGLGAGVYAVGAWLYGAFGVLGVVPLVAVSGFLIFLLFYALNEPPKA